MQCSNVQLKSRRTPETDDGGSSVANINQTPRQGNVVPMRKRRGPEPVDQNPFHETQDETFSKQYDATQRYTNPKSDPTGNVQRKYAAVNANQTPSHQPSRRQVVSNKVKHKPDKSKVMSARMRATAINGWVGGWAMFWYLSFQVPFASES